MRSKQFLSVLAAAMMIAVLTVTAQAADSKVLNVRPVKPVVRMIPNVVFSQVPSRGFENISLQMDILMPKREEKMPAVVYVPGGWFINVNRTNALQERMGLAEAGYVVASISYRVVPNDKFPAPLQDVKSAIRFLRANADRFGIDPERIGVMGGSAGGYLAAFAATTSGGTEFDVGDNLDQSSAVKCAVDLFGLSDLTQVAADYSEERQAAHHSSGAMEALLVNGSAELGGTEGGILADRAAAEKANPIAYINEKSAPMLLMHGDADTVISPSQTDILFQALVEGGVPAERYILHGAEHGGLYWAQDETINVIIGFFDKYLKN